MSRVSRPNQRNKRMGSNGEHRKGAGCPQKRSEDVQVDYDNLLIFWLIVQLENESPMIDPPPHLLRVTSLYMNRDDFYRVGQGFIVTGNKMEDRCQHQPDQLNCKCSYFGFYPANNSKAKREVTGTDLVAHDRLWEIRPSVFNSNLS